MTPMPVQSSAITLLLQVNELAKTAPVVVAKRVSKMALSAINPNVRYRDDLTHLVEEKVSAFQESWAAMVRQTLSVQQDLSDRALQAFSTPLSPNLSVLPGSLLWSVLENGLSIVSKGLEPILSRTVANSKRLTFDHIADPQMQ